MNNLGLALIQKADYSGAVETFRRLLAIKPIMPKPGTTWVLPEIRDERVRARPFVAALSFSQRPRGHYHLALHRGRKLMKPGYFLAGSGQSLISESALHSRRSAGAEREPRCRD
jgi:hypothetical protein